MPETDAIDKKRSDNATSTDQIDNQLDILKNLAIQIAYIGIFTVIGTMILYTTRGASTNLFPTNMDCMPYTVTGRLFYNNKVGDDSSTPIDKVDTNVNITNTGKGYVSTKMTFDIKKNLDSISNSGFFPTLRGWREGPKSSNFTLYFAYIIQSILALNFSITQWVYNIFNIFPEWLVVFLFLIPFIGTACLSIFLMFYVGLGFVDIVYFIILVFTQIPKFFYEKEPTVIDKNPINNWKDTHKMKWYHWFLVLIPLILFWPLGMIACVFAAIAIILTIALPVNLKTTVETKDGKDKPYGVLSLIKNIFLYKRHIVMFLVAFYLLYDVIFSEIDITIKSSIIFSVIFTILVLYITTKLFLDEMLDKSDIASGPLTLTQQIIVECKNVIQDKAVGVSASPVASGPTTANANATATTPAVTTSAATETITAPANSTPAATATTPTAPASPDITPTNATAPPITPVPETVNPQQVNTFTKGFPKFGIPTFGRPQENESLLDRPANPLLTTKPLAPASSINPTGRNFTPRNRGVAPIGGDNEMTGGSALKFRS